MSLLVLKKPTLEWSLISSNKKQFLHAAIFSKIEKKRTFTISYNIYLTEKQKRK